jgi:hypothetical protein
MQISYFNKIFINVIQYISQFADFIVYNTGDFIAGVWRCFIERRCYLFQNPLAVDLVISLPQDGIRLIFDPVVQRLKVRVTGLFFKSYMYTETCYFFSEIINTFFDIVYLPFFSDYRNL